VTTGGSSLKVLWYESEPRDTFIIYEDGEVVMPTGPGTYTKSGKAKKVKVKGGKKK